ncbi:unnamed protein product, partial [Medioppia subpectinata]
MDNKPTEPYEDITLNNDSQDVIDENDCQTPDEEEEETPEDVEEVEDELQRISQQLSKDYFNYFQFDISPEKKETEDAVEDLLTHLEEFCGLIEMIRNDSNICVEEVTKKMTNECQSMEHIYGQIDRLDQFVKVVANTVQEMDNELTKAEQLFADDNNNKVKKFFTSFLTNNSKQNHLNNKRLNVKYEPKDIFKTSDYIT